MTKHAVSLQVGKADMEEVREEVGKEVADMVVGVALAVGVVLVGAEPCVEVVVVIATGHTNAP